MSGKIYKINKTNNFYPKNKYVHAYYEKEPTEPKPSIIIPTHTDVLKSQFSLDFDKSEFDLIYSHFKSIEKGLKTELDKLSEKNALIKMNDLAKLMKIFIDCGESLFLKNLKISAEKQIDRRMWLIFKLDIEKKMKIEVLSDLKELVEGKLVFINKMILKFAELYPDLNNSEISINNMERKIMSSFCHFLGEVNEFKDKTENKGKIKSPEKIIINYNRAINFYPYEGKYYMSFASCAFLNNDNLSAIYWGMRSLMAEIPFDGRENLQEFFEKAKKSYEVVMKDKADYAEINPKDTVRLFLNSFLRYLYIFFTKISFEKTGEVSSYMMDFLSKFVSYLKNDEKIDKAKESMVLASVIQMIIFSMFYTIEGFDIEEKSPEKKIQKTIEQMENNVIYRECLQYSFCMFYQIYSLLLVEENDAFLNLLMPTLYYLVTYKNVQRFLFEKFPKFKQLLIKISDKLKKKLLPLNGFCKHKKEVLEEENKNQEKQIEEIKSEESENFDEILENSLLLSDKALIGFAPLKKFFSEFKKNYKIHAKDNQNILKTYLACQLLEKMGCNIETTEENSNDILMKMEFEVALMEDFKTLDLSHLKAEDMKDKSKTLIVIDGQNVALRHKEEQFSSKALKMVVDYWLKKGYMITILLPDICFSKETVSKKKELAKQTKTKNSIKNLPDDIEILLDLKKRGFASGIPNWTYDDSYIIDYAKKKNAYILTNDRYRDHIENYSKNDAKLKEDLRLWIKDHCIKYIFI